MKIECNENLTSIINYINDFEGFINWFDLTQYVIDYKMYKEYYLNLNLIKILVEYHNYQINTKVWVKPN